MVAPPIELRPGAGGGRPGSPASLLAARGEVARQRAAPLGERAVPGLFDPGRIVERVRRELGSARLAERYRTDLVEGPAGRVRVVSQAGVVTAPELPTAGEARAALQSLLELVHGVGPRTAERLRRSGVTSVVDLLADERFAAVAGEVCGEWAASDLVGICDRLQARFFGRGHLLSALVASCVSLEEIVFVDLETLGLAGNVVFLCGIGRFGPAGFTVEQLLAPSYGDEAALLARVGEAIGRARILVTYNGRAADQAWLRARSFFHGLPPLPEPAHLDLVFGTRRRFVLDEPVLSAARLPVVQRVLLGMARPALDVPSAAVPLLYQEYVRSGSEGLLVPILEHNRCDLEALVVLLGRLAGEALAACR